MSLPRRFRDCPHPLYLPELRPLIGKTVEIIVLEEPLPTITPGTGDWDAAVEAEEELEDDDFDALQSQREAELDRTAFGKSSVELVTKVTPASQRWLYLKPVVIFMALAVAFLAGTICQRASDEAEMNQWALVGRLRNAGLLPQDEAEAEDAADNFGE